MSDFSCFHSKETIFTNRLYVGLNQVASEIKATVFAKRKEKKGLGMTEYGNILGLFLSFINIAFKTKDNHGNDLYINKKSFCHLINRLQKNNQKYNFFNTGFIENEYNTKKDHQTKQKLKEIYQTFNRVFPNLLDKNIGEVAIVMLRETATKKS